MYLGNSKEIGGESPAVEQLYAAVLPGAKKTAVENDQREFKQSSAKLPPTARQEDVENVNFFPNVGKFFSDCYEGLKKAIGYVPNIPESIVYVVALNVPSALRAVASLVVIPAKCISTIFSKSNLFDFEKILVEEKEAILMVEPKSRWINAVRGFFNEYVPGGSLLGEDEVFSRTGDEKLKEILNPLNNISNAIVEPLTTPLHDVAQGLTDRITYSVYIHFSKEKSLGYPEFLKEVEDEKNWQLRMGRTAIYSVETLAIAYYCGGAGAKSKREALERTSGFLKMPFVMTGLQVLGSVLKREDFHKLSTEQVLVVLATEIPKGMFDSAVFMLPISKISQWKIERGINKLNQQMLASSTSAKLPIPIGQYQADVNKLVARTQAWSELFDFAEGMPDAQTKGVELKDCLIQLAYNPFSATNWRLTGATALEFTSSALDLVDAKHNKGHQESLHSVSENTQSKVDESLKANTYELAGGIEEVQQYFRDHHYRKLSLQGAESVLSYFGITPLSSKDQLRNEIEQRSKSVYAFYDGERDVIFAPKLPEDASTNQKQLHQSFVQHEEFHRKVAHHPEGIVGVLSTETELADVINLMILPIHNEYHQLTDNIPNLSLKLLEEYAAVASQLLMLGDSTHSPSLIYSAVSQGTLEFTQGIMAASKNLMSDKKLRDSETNLGYLYTRLRKLNSKQNDFSAIEVLRFAGMIEPYVLNKTINLESEYSIANERIKQAKQIRLSDSELDIALVKRLFGGRGKGNATYYVTKLKAKGLRFKKREGLFTQGNPAFFVAVKELKRITSLNPKYPAYRLLTPKKDLKLVEFEEFLGTKPLLSLLECSEVLEMSNGFVSNKITTGKLTASGLSGTNEFVLIDDLISFMKKNGKTMEADCLDLCREEYSRNSREGLERYRLLRDNSLSKEAPSTIDDYPFDIQTFYPLLGFSGVDHKEKKNLNLYLEKRLKQLGIVYKKSNKLKTGAQTTKEIYIQLSDFILFLKTLGAISRAEILESIRQRVLIIDEAHPRRLIIPEVKNEVAKACALNPLLNTIEVGHILGVGRRRMLKLEKLPCFTWLVGKRVTLKKYPLLDILLYLDENGQQNLARLLLDKRKEYLDEQGDINQSILFGIIDQFRRK